MKIRPYHMCLLLPLFAHGQNNLITQPNLRAYYNYETTSANTVTDQAGGNDNATSSTGAWTAGGNPSGPGFAGNASFNPGDGLSNRSTLLAGNALNIADIYNQHLVVPLGTATLGASFTLSTWHYLAPGSGNTSARYFVFEPDTGFDVSWGTGAAVTGGDSYLSYVGQTSGHGQTLARNQWHLATHVFTTSGSDTILSTYVNGALLGTRTTLTANMGFSSLYFGDARNGTSPDRDWDGMIDETSIWTRGLSAPEVSSLYSLGQAGLALGYTTEEKANNLTALGTGSSWSSSSAPALGEVAVFNSTYAQSGTLPVAAPLNLSGIQVSTGSTLIDIGNTSNAITLGPRGLDMSTAARDLTIANLTTSGHQIWDVTSGRTFTAGALAGSDSIYKQGAGSVVLNGSSPFSGTFNVNAGTIQLSGGSALGNSATVVMSNTAGATLQLNASETIGALSGGGTSGGNVNLQANTLTTGNSANQTYAGVMSGTGGFTKTGSGNMTLQALQTYTGSTTVSQGTLTLDFNQTGSYNVNTIPRDITVNPGAALVVARGGQFGYGAYQETVTLNAATLTFGNSIHNYLNHLVLSNGSTATFGSGGFSGIANFGLSTVTVQASSTGNTITGGSIQAGLTANVADGAATNDLTIGSNLVDYSGSQGLTKNGAGTLYLTGSNSYTGNTVIQGGTLKILNDAAIANSGTVKLEAGTLRLAGVNAGSEPVTTPTTRSMTFTGGIFEWGNGTLAATDQKLEFGTVDRTAPAGAPSGPTVREGSYLVYDGNLTTGNGVNADSVLDLGEMYTGNGLRYNQFRVSGTLNLASLNDVLNIDLNPYFLRPSSPDSVFTGDWGTLVLVRAETITGQFSTHTGITSDGIGWSNLGVTTSFVDPASLNLNEYIIEYRTGYGVASGGDAILLHYKVAGSVPEPASAGLLVAGTMLLRALSRGRKPSR